MNVDEYEETDEDEKESLESKNDGRVMRVFFSVHSVALMVTRSFDLPFRYRYLCRVLSTGLGSTVIRMSWGANCSSFFLN